MQLHAVIVPPPDVVDSALRAARDLVPPAPPVVEVPKPGFLDRLRGRRPAEPEAPPVITWVPAAPDAVFVGLAKFGNVTADDAEGLATALEAVAATWPAPVVQVTRLRVAEAHPFDVTAELEGDVDALRDIFRNVNEVARLQRFFLDRRSFRSELVVGSVEGEDGAPVPATVLGVEAPHAGPTWSPSHVTLVRASFGGSGTTYSELSQVTLAPGVVEPGAGSGD
jgi:2'-5' RNA ligase